VTHTKQNIIHVVNGSRTSYLSILDRGLCDVLSLS